jgi:hypothetical protein
MSLSPPHLSRRDLIEEVEAIHRKPHRGWERRDYTTALFGSGESTHFDVNIDGRPVRFAAVSVHCELELRQALAEHSLGSLAVETERSSDQLALLVDFGDPQLPLDLQAALSGGRIYTVSKEQRLARRLGARLATAELLGSPVAAALLAGPTELPPVKGTTADLDFGVRALLRLHADFQVAEGELSDDRVLAFCAGAPGHRFWVEMAERFTGLREAVRRHLRHEAGELAALTFLAWEQGKGRQAAALAVVLEASADDIESNDYLRARLKELLAGIDPSLRELPVAALKHWGELADPMLRRLEREDAISSGSTITDSVIAEADTLLTDHELAPVIGKSRRLTSAFAYTKHLLAERVLAFASRPTRETFKECAQLLEQLASHRSAEQKAGQSQVQRVRMAVRLMAWMLSRQDLTTELADGPEYLAATRTAQLYAEQGGFVDFARRAARGSVADPLGAAIGKLLERVDTLRDQDDLTFKRGLPKWLEAGRTSPDVLPIDRALEALGVAFLVERADRKLLVLLMDGMSWSNAVELLLDLEQQRIAPLSWRPPAPLQLRGDLLLPPVLANFPTVTDVSRSAFFAGKLISPTERDTSRDPGRFANHAGLRKLMPDKPPRLLLRANVQADGGQASVEAISLVRSTDRVVGIVINAIDEQLKAGQQIDVDYNTRSIRPLADLLTAAAQAERAVLLVADHGHVPGTRLRPITASFQALGARWRALGDGEKALESEVALKGPGVCVPRGKEAVALLVRETDVHGSLSHQGEHGGAALAEVVAPALLIGAESLSAQHHRGENRDGGLDQRAFPRPLWWDLQLPVPKVATTATGKPKVIAEQPGLFPRELTAETPTAPTPMPRPRIVVPADAPWRKRVEEVLKAKPESQRPKLLAEILPRIQLLLEADNNQLAPAEFAARANLMTFRVPGAIASMQEVLNLDGYWVVTYEQAQQLVRLDRPLFRQLFEEKA